jgi:hypothetical protein
VKNSWISRILNKLTPSRVVDYLQKAKQKLSSARARASTAAPAPEVLIEKKKDFEKANSAS